MCGLAAADPLAAAAFAVMGIDKLSVSAPLVNARKSDIDVLRTLRAVLPIDINKSEWQCKLEPVNRLERSPVDDAKRRLYGVRMGLRYVKGLGNAERFPHARNRGERRKRRGRRHFAGGGGGSS